MRYSISFVIACFMVVACSKSDFGGAAWPPALPGAGQFFGTLKGSGIKDFEDYSRNAFYTNDTVRHLIEFYANNGYDTLNFNFTYSDSICCKTYSISPDSCMLTIDGINWQIPDTGGVSVYVYYQDGDTLFGTIGGNIQSIQIKDSTAQLGGSFIIPRVPAAIADSLFKRS